MREYGSGTARGAARLFGMHVPDAISRTVFMSTNKVLLRENTHICMKDDDRTIGFEIFSQKDISTVNFLHLCPDFTPQKRFNELADAATSRF